MIILLLDVIFVFVWKVIEIFFLCGGKVLFWGRKFVFFIDKSFIVFGFLLDLINSRIELFIRWIVCVSFFFLELEMKIILFVNDFICYMCRVMFDGDFYFIFNEGNKVIEFIVDFDKVGVVKEWNVIDGIF